MEKEYKKSKKMRTNRSANRKYSKVYLELNILLKKR